MQVYQSPHATDDRRANPTATPKSNALEKNSKLKLFFNCPKLLSFGLHLEQINFNSYSKSINFRNIVNVNLKRLLRQ